ncbi:hypothetical protein [Salinigranum marinum]|uniref:hypothetical protein n=1 Tax=Salinigranum marinum TaxID=1515595 RepID=UPI002989E2F8|nr:hypothetical protein [Salinigranum marinum]
MGEFDPGQERSTGDCTTTESFSDHGVDDAVDLVTRTYYGLTAAERAGFSPDDSLFDRLESAFVWAYLSSVDEPEVPPHVERSIDDAREAFADRSDADLRTDVLLAFYGRVAGFHCLYRAATTNELSTRER